MENNIFSTVIQVMNEMGIMKFFLPIFIVTITLRMIRFFLVGDDVINLPSKTYEENKEEQEKINHVIIQPYPKKRRKIYYHTCNGCGAGAKYFLCEYCGTPAYNLQDGYDEN